MQIVNMPHIMNLTTTCIYKYMIHILSIHVCTYIYIIYIHIHVYVYTYNDKRIIHQLYYLDINVNIYDKNRANTRAIVSNNSNNSSKKRVIIRNILNISIILFLYILLKKIIYYNFNYNFN